MSETKRNYIRRKKYLNDCYEKIHRTLLYIRTAGNFDFSEQHIKAQAMKYAQTIEATCWSPHLRLSAREYEELTNNKTKEDCCTRRGIKIKIPCFIIWC